MNGKSQSGPFGPKPRCCQRMMRLSVLGRICAISVAFFFVLHNFTLVRNGLPIFHHSSLIEKDLAWFLKDNSQYLREGWGPFGSATDSDSSLVLVVYLHLEQTRTAAENFRLYLEQLEEEDTLPSIKQVVVIREESFNQMNQSLTTVVDVEKLSSQHSCSHHRSSCAVLGCLLSTWNYDYSSVVMVDSTMVGPIYPKYATGLVHWSQAYSQFLRNEVMVVSSTIQCTDPDAEASLEGVLAFSRTLLPLVDSKDWSQARTRFLTLILQRKMSFRVLHGPAMDYSRFGGNATKICYHSVEPPHFVRDYDLHPTEVFFVDRRDTDNAQSEVYKNWMAPAVRDVPPGNEGVLVVFAFYEKERLYRDNLDYFLRATVLSDARSGLGANVDTTIIVNGNTSLSFPDSLDVLFRDNTCFDFGSWGVGLKRALRDDHKYVILLNSGTRGPFLPTYFRGHWTDAVVSMLQTKDAVGLAVNCPDGAGNVQPHVMSMFMGMKRHAIDLAMENGLFDCSESYDTAVKAEGQLSKLLLANDMKLDSFQMKYRDVDWQAFARDNPVAHANQHGFQQCGDVDLDIFYRPEWYNGMTPHPFEFMFYKTNRGVGISNIDSLTKIGIAESAPRDVIMLVSHWLEGDGAPLMLAQLAFEWAKKFHVVVVSRAGGVLKKELEKAGIEVRVLEPKEDFNYAWADYWEPLLHQYQPTLVVFNTIIWANTLAKFPLLRPKYPRIAWMIHENEIVPEAAIEGFWFGSLFPSIRTPADRQETLSRVDKVVWVADAVRELWSDADDAKFITFHCFVTVSRIVQRANMIPQNELSRIAEERSVPAVITILQKGKASLKKNRDFVITLSGSYCPRKRQMWMMEALSILLRDFSNLKVQFLGKPSEVGGSGGVPYFSKMQDLAKKLQIENAVEFIPFSPDAVKYVARANLHVSVSSHEAFPLNTLEAMILGTPVALTPAGGSWEQLQKPGTDGFRLANVTSPADLARELKPILQLDEQSLERVGREGQLTAFNLFSDLQAEERVETLTELLLEAA